jgi:N-acetyl-anhydromuramyl-L-alanine amidase AmpD
MQNSCNRLVLAFLVLSLTSVQAAETPALLTREAWQAKAPSRKISTQKPVAILIHHTGSAMKPKTSLTAKMKGLQRFSQANEKLSDGRMKPAWPDVPYHFYIAADGQVAEGRDINAVGDTNTGYDASGYIQVVVEGNFDKEQLMEAQAESLKKILKWLKGKYMIKASAIKMHKDKAQTACPGKNLEVKLPRIISDLK